MKAKIRLSTTDKLAPFPNYEGEIEFDLDETYWRGVFAAAALNRLIGVGQDGRQVQGIAHAAFNVADAMCEEMRKRK